MVQETTVISRTETQTKDASVYLQQLCKHFAHKLPVEVTPEAGCIQFSIGTMRARAQDGVLVLTAEAADEPTLAKLEDVIARHLVRFMFREPPTLAWTRM